MALKRHSKFNSAPALVDVDGAHLLMSRYKVRLPRRGESPFGVKYFALLSSQGNT